MIGSPLEEKLDLSEYIASICGINSLIDIYIYNNLVYKLCRNAPSQGVWRFHLVNRGPSANQELAESND